MLLESSHGGALILQVKEAAPSELNFGLSPLVARDEGQRVIEMQRTMQGASDPLLGWTSLGGADYYVRQYRDLKWAPEPTEFSEGNLASYARLCATALARAHARGADPASGALAQISGYITDSPGQPPLRRGDGHLRARLREGDRPRPRGAQGSALTELTSIAAGRKAEQHVDQSACRGSVPQRWTASVALIGTREQRGNV